MTKSSYIESQILTKINRKSNRIACQLVIALIASFIIALSAQIIIPIGIIPITLQTFMVALITLLFGRNTAVLTVSMYITEILSGMPFMAGANVLNPASLMNFGYIVAFIPLAYVLGTIADRETKYKLKTIILVVTIANIIVYTCGALWLGLFIGFDQNLLMIGVLPFIVPDVIKMTCAVLISKIIYSQK